MNEVLNAIRTRRAVRHFRADALPEEVLDSIIDAGLWAPSSGGGQGAFFAVCTDAAANEALGRANRAIFGKALPVGAHDVNPVQISIAEDDSLTSAFYGAPVVLALLSPPGRDIAYPGAYNCMAAAENMMLAAWSLGVGSVFVSRASETFLTETGKQWLARASVPQGYVAHGFLCLGFPDGTPGEGRLRKGGRIFRFF